MVNVPMSDETDYLVHLQQLGLIYRHSPSVAELTQRRLLEVGHARAWFVASLPEHAPEEWKLFVDTWRMLPADEGLPFLMLKSWLRRWHADVRWMENWMVNAAWAIRRGDDTANALSRSQLRARELGHSLTHPRHPMNVADGTWREELDDEQGPSGRESEDAFLSRMKRVFQRRRQEAGLPWPSTILDRDAAWFVRYQVAGEDLSAMRDVRGARGDRRSIDVVLLAFSSLIGLLPSGSLGRAPHPSA